MIDVYFIRETFLTGPFAGIQITRYTYNDTVFPAPWEPGDEYETLIVHDRMRVDAIELIATVVPDVVDSTIKSHKSLMHA